MRTPIKLVSTCLAIAMLSFSLLEARADFQFSIGNGTGLINPILVTPGSSVAIPVYIEVQPAPFDQLRGYDLAIDFGGDGFGLPSAFPVHAGIGGNLVSDFPTTSFVVDNSTAPTLDSLMVPVNWDVKYSGTFSSTQTVTPTQRKLFDIVFTVPNSAAPGIYAINLVTTTQPAGLSTITLPSGATSLEFNAPWNGSIQVVPEPSSFMLSSLVIAGLGLIRRRSRS